MTQPTHESLRAENALLRKQLAMAVEIGMDLQTALNRASLFEVVEKHGDLDARQDLVRLQRAVSASFDLNQVALEERFDTRVQDLEIMRIAAVDTLRRIQQALELRGEFALLYVHEQIRNGLSQLDADTVPVTSTSRLPYDYMDWDTADPDAELPPSEVFRTRGLGFKAFLKLLFGRTP